MGASGVTLPSGRNQSLDVLRGIAILLVIGHHLKHYAVWGRAGWIGVDLFFVLSGFLISGLLFQEYKLHGKIDLIRFISRRGFKIWPPFYLCMTVVAALIALGRPATFPWKGFIATWLFVGNYVPRDLPSPVGHAWSLAVEEHFYLFLPLLLMLLIAARKLNAIPYIFVGVASVCLGLRWLSHDDGPYILVTRATHLRIDSLFAGVTLGYLFHFRQEWFQKMTGHYALLITLICCLPTAFVEENSHMMQTFGLPGLFIGFSFLVAWSLVRAPSVLVLRGLASVAATIGFYSYSIYLWHRPISILFASRKDSGVAFWVYLVGAVTVGIAMSKLIEMPALRLRDKWQPAFGMPSSSRVAQCSFEVSLPGAGK
jgi:peptidoglycan/LPS O-acetylase OafA/YrhL